MLKSEQEKKSKKVKVKIEKSDNSSSSTSIKTEEKLEDEPILIAGCLKTHGWAVYTGVSLSDSNHFGVLDELENSINKKGYKSKWTTIDSGESKKVLGDRKYLRINPSIEKESVQFEHINSYFDSIQSTLRKIKNFDRAILKKHSRLILRNAGNASEQYVHRDEPIVE